MSHHLPLMLAAACGTLLGAAAVAHADPPLDPNIAIDRSFSLQGTNGYTLNFRSYNDKGDPKTPSVEVRVGKADATNVYQGRYTVHGTLRGDLLTAKFGRLGRIDVRISTGRTRIVRPSACKQGLVRRPATYRGTIRFAAAGGYTKVAASTARGVVDDLIRCRPRPTRDATHPSLDISDGRTYFRAIAARRPAFEVSRIGTRAGVELHQYLVTTGTDASFAFDMKNDTAQIAPPGPYLSGVGAYDGSQRSASRKWTGNLSVRFPDGSRYPIKGSQIYTSKSPVPKVWSGRLTD